ncbi:FapA family protein [Sporosarcina koreensis]|uniref:FapA family protein n=1 Tax=Sporosarcina koreensis TaxID=334735 RepID=A0ABW0TSU9_9BACL
MEKSVTAKSLTGDEFFYDGNVDIRSGNIQFDGDVRIGKGVEASMFVSATGKVFIQGSVQKATVEAGTSAIIEGNVLSSTVEVGMQEVLEEVLAAQLSGLLTYLDRISGAILEIIHIRGVQPAEVDAKELKDLVRVTLKEEYLEFQHDKLEFIQKVKNHSTQLSSDWERITGKLYNIFTNTSMTVVRNAEEFSQLLKEAHMLIEQYSAMGSGGSQLKLPYAINSVLSCNGTIEVTDFGLYNCSVTAKNRVSVEGCCRGGVIVAGEKVSIKETGSTKGVKTVVKTESGGTITIGLARCGTEIWVGDEVYHVDADELGIHARMKDGQLQIH